MAASVSLPSMVVIVPAQMSLEELDALPEDGGRYELLDGEVLVTPAPSGPHNEIADELRAVFKENASETFVVLTGYQLHPPGERRFIPDVSLLRSDDYGYREATRPPVLVVEVLSPTGANVDLTAKLRAYAEFGIGHYWVAEPMAPTVVALELDAAGRYRVTAEASGDKPLVVERPFPLEVVPAELRRHQPIDAAFEPRLDLAAAVRVALDHQR